MVVITGYYDLTAITGSRKQVFGPPGHGFSFTDLVRFGIVSSDYYHLSLIPYTGHVYKSPSATHFIRPSIGIRFTMSEAMTRSMQCPSIMISTRIVIVEAPSSQCHCGMSLTVCHYSGETVGFQYPVWLLHNIDSNTNMRVLETIQLLYTHTATILLLYTPSDRVQSFTMSEAMTGSMHSPSIMISTRIVIVEAPSQKFHRGNSPVKRRSSGSSPKAGCLCQL